MTDHPKGVADHPAKNQMEEIWRSGGRAKDIISFLEENSLPLVKESTVARYGQRFWNEKIKISSEASATEIAETLQEIEEAGIASVVKMGFTKKKFPGWEKIDGQNVQVEKESTSWNVDLVPVPTLPEKASVGDFRISVKGVKRLSKPSGWSLGVVIPDPQIGYHRDTDSVLTTTHDESALDVAHQITAYLNSSYGIDLTVILGDNHDFSAFSTHRTAPGYTINTQLEIDRFGTEVALQRQLAPDAEIIVLSGNHDDRLNKAILDKIPGLSGISKSNSRDPVLSIANLCRFDEYNITSIESYPDGEYWANDYLRFEHGHIASSTPGSTAAKYLADARVSTIFGHTHRQELVYSRIRERSGSRPIFAGSPGTTARIDGVLPSYSTGITSSGKQAAQKTEKWQQGIFVVWYQTGGDQKAVVEPVLIEDGAAFYAGSIYESTVDKNGEKL
jgi:predicted phosphodiesterase